MLRFDEETISWEGHPSYQYRCADSVQGVRLLGISSTKSVLEKMIKALGDGGLNEYDQTLLVALAGGEEGSEDVEEDDELGEVSGSEEEGEEVPEEDGKAEEGGSGSGSETEQGGSSGDDALALDELGGVELHPDAIPRYDVKAIDNKVRDAQI